MKKQIDSTLECAADELASAKFLRYSCEIETLKACNIFIVTVPTPIDKYKRPDLSPLVSASKMLSKVIKNGDIIIFESTVYPGATEEICVPQIEDGSGLVYNKDFL